MLGTQLRPSRRSGVGAADLTGQVQVVKGPGWGGAWGEAGGRAGDGWTGAEGPQEEGSLGEKAEALVLTRKAALLRQLTLSGLGSRGGAAPSASVPDLSPSLHIWEEGAGPAPGTAAETEVRFGG